MCLPHDDQDGLVKSSEGPHDETSIYAIEEYQDQAALDGLMACELVQTLLSDLEREEHHKHHLHKNTIVSSEVHTLPAAISYTRHTTAHCKDPFIVLASFTFQSGGTGTALSGFREFVDYSESNESQTLSYTILEDKEANQLRTVEV